MGNNKKKDELWKEAYRKCRLSTRHIQMAKELGLNPRSLIKNIPNQHEQWKLPVRDWIENMYEKRFKNRDKKINSIVNRKAVVAIGYYRREEWERFLACADDRDKLENTREEWLVSFNKAFTNARASGINPKKVIVNLDELIEFCTKHGKKNDAETRSRFIAELARQGKSEEII